MAALTQKGISFFVLLALSALMGSSAALAAPRQGLDARPSNPTCIAPEPPPLPFNVRAEPVFQSVGLRRPLYMVQPPADDNRWYLAQRSGLIKTFPNDPATTNVQVALDLLDRFANTALSNTEHSEQWGIVSLDFHPDFPATPYLYVAYNANQSPTTREVWSFLSRFTLNADGITFDPASEKILMTFPQASDAILHHLDHITFGPDGLLYIANGDGGMPYRDRAQDLTNIYGKILRIDVDTGDPYGIPPDNPFADGVGGAPEIYAWGLRNPWRISFDRSSGELWLGDVGNSSWEEIDRIEKGKNYGWPILEGVACFPSGVQVCDGTGTEPPVHVFGHDIGTAAIGGYVYRGPTLTGLQGMYLFGAPTTASIWGLKFQGGQWVRRTLFQLPNQHDPDSFAEGNDGELYVLSFEDDAVYKIVDSDPVDPPPGTTTVAELLSETGCFEAANPQNPLPGLIPFDIAAPLWSDAAAKTRLLAMPDDRQVTIESDGDFTFPIGTVLVKNFFIDDKPIETRLFVRHPDGNWGGYSYEWLDDLSDAELLPAEGKTKDIPLAAGGTLSWTYPSRDNCFACHNSVARFSLGPDLVQLNSLHTYPSTGVRANQLATWAHIGLFKTALPAQPAQLAAVAPPTDPTASVVQRARSYLHGNCSYCHRPGGPARATADLRFQTPLAQMNVCNEPWLQSDLGVPDAVILDPGSPKTSILSLRMNTRDDEQMPPLGTELVDEHATGLIRRWIRGADVCDTTIGDTDGDGVTDNADNCVSHANPDQRDSNRDGIGDRCDGDFNGDRQVDNADLRMLEGKLGKEQGMGGFIRDRDLDGDFDVDLTDYKIFKTLFGRPPGPSCCG
jgi:uncharacterized repeat protein (TIGR03806 family)